MRKRVCILGSTGSIGQNALKVISNLPKRFEVSGLAAQGNVDLLIKQAKEFRPKSVAIVDESKASTLRKGIKSSVKVFTGVGGVEALAGLDEADIVLIGISGSASIRPAYAAVSHGKDVALASMHALDSAGHLITRIPKRKHAAIIPVDSEHSAVFQCLRGDDVSHVKGLYITASGGPLREMPRSAFKGLTRKVVLKHPKWKMGKKISVDSATMINKGLEMIEAKWLFGIGIERIKILIHPEAIVHSMVEFVDGSVLAQLGITDMRLPIQYALSYPKRYPSLLKPLDLVSMRSLTFHKPDVNKFPSLGLASSAACEGGSAPCALNASNEAAVHAFLQGRLTFTDIPKAIERVLSIHKRIDLPTLEQIETIEQWAREEVEKFCSSR